MSITRRTLAFGAAALALLPGAGPAFGQESFHPKNARPPVERWSNPPEYTPVPVKPIPIPKRALKKLLLAGVAALSVLCSSGAHADEGHRNVWQCGNVRVTYLPKKLSPDDWFPTDYEYIVTGIEKSNNRFKWTEGDLYLNGKLCWPVEPLTCLKIDGTMEPCESRQISLPRPRPAEAPEPVPIPKTVLYYEPGGHLHIYEERWRKLAESGDDVEIRGPCVSGCTMIMAYVPSNRICFGWGASLRFHLAGTPENPSTGASLYMLNRYPQDIRMWLRDRGGVEKMTVEKFWVLDATELWEMGYRKCDPEAPPVPMTTKSKARATEEEERERWRKRDEKAEETWRKYQKALESWHKSNIDIGR